MINRKLLLIPGQTQTGLGPRVFGPDGRCFHAAWAVSKSVHSILKMTDRNQTYQNGRVSTHSDVQCGSANQQTSFSGRGNARIKLPFSGHIANKFQRPTILQLNIEGLTASKMNVLHHLAMQSEALVILLQETHCTDAEKLVLPNYQLAGSSLSRKHCLATFVHEQWDTCFWTNLYRHRRSSGCVWTLMAIK